MWRNLVYKASYSSEGRRWVLGVRSLKILNIRNPNSEIRKRRAKDEKDLFDCWSFIVTCYLCVLCSCSKGDAPLWPCQCIDLSISHRRVAFAKAVEEKSKGTLEVKIFPLGSSGRKGYHRGASVGDHRSSGTSLESLEHSLRSSISTTSLYFQGAGSLYESDPWTARTMGTQRSDQRGEKVDLKPSLLLDQPFECQ